MLERVTRRLYGNSRENCKVQEENPWKSRGKSLFFLVFSMIFWPKTIPKRSDNPSDLFEPVSASPDLSRPNLHWVLIPNKFQKQMQKQISKKTCKSLKKSTAYLKVWDHSQSVDLIFLIRIVSTRAPETHWAPHWWQNNVPKNDDREFSPITMVSDNQGFWRHRHLRITTGS